MSETPPIGEQVAAALAPTVRRLDVEEMRRRNDAALQRLAQVHKIGIAVHDIISVHLAVLVEQLLGDMDDPRRLDYEHAVQAKLAGLIAQAEAQAARATLLNGVRLDPRNLPGRG